jgi:D-alanyl-D-alanine carboxypeptidase/D-alanyl-D-alanine-endopeptidase (penicillin-binding protein 4)
VRRVIATLLVLGGLAAAAPASAYTAADLRNALTREMRGATAASGAYVRDLDAGTDLFALRADAPRVPASVEKLYTTATALLRMGPAATLDTRAVSTGEIDADGVLRGDLVLVGGGDPFFGDTSAAKLARAVKAAGVARIDGAVLGDESAFDLRRSGCCAGYGSDLGGVLSALAYNGGFYGGALQLHAARFAATRFAEQLRSAGVRSSGKPRAGSAPAAASDIAIVPSMPLRELIRAINVPSNNFAAEMLLKVLGAQYRNSGTTGAGATVVRETLTGVGVRARVADGSGLSRSDRTSPRDVVTLLERMDRPDVGEPFRSSLAVSGRTGTVRGRMRGTAAAARCRVKTGTLHNVSGLAGYCRTAGGRDIAFSLMFNRATPYVEKAREDRIAAAIARLEGSPDSPPAAREPAPASPPAAPEPAPSGGAGGP